MPTLIRSLIVALLGFSLTSWAAPFGATLCQTPGYSCQSVPEGATWTTLFPNEQERALVKRLNRINIQVRAGSIIAIPDEPLQDYLAYSPLPAYIPATENRTIIVDPAKLAWAAYNSTGELVHWGPMSAGNNWCKDIGKPCHTVVGTFSVYRKGGPNCKSGTFPLPKGGAPMPYCMFFKGGYAIHASTELPGYNASHGCARILYEDAQWLNQHFVSMGTRVIVLPYPVQH